MSNIRDAQDSFEQGRKAWEAFITEFTLEWEAPRIAEDVVMGLQMMPPEIIERLPKETQARLRAIMGGRNAR